MRTMLKLGKTVIVVGSIMIILGIIFHLQGQSIVGPQSSFMYSNPEWITYGMQIAILGLIITGAGIGLVVFRKLS